MSNRLPAGSAAAARRVTGSCGDFTLDGVKFRVVCGGNLEMGLESDTQVGLLAIYIRTITIISTLSAPQDVTNVIKTRSRLRVWVGIVHILLDFQFFFHGSTKQFNQLAEKKFLKFFSLA